MDTTRNITFREYVLNDEDIQSGIVGGGAAGSGISGCVIDTFDITDVDVVQWLEKRSQADGSDAGDAFLGPRRVRVAGTLYATTRLTLFDELFALRAALNPVLAQREEPLDKGYRPLYFSVPTNRAVDYPAGAIELMVKALPRGIRHVTQRDSLGGEDDEALAIPWEATFICKDPGIYAQAPQEVEFDTFPGEVTGVTSVAATDIITKNAHGLVLGNRITFHSLTGGAGLSTGTAYYIVSPTTNTFKVSLTSGGATVDHTTNITDGSYIQSTTFSGTWTNRGTYLGKFNAIFVVRPGAGSISVTVGDSIFTITVPLSTVNRTIRVKDDKILTFEESSVEVPQMSRINFTGDTTWPLVDPGDTAYSVTFHGMAGLVAGGRMWFYEQYA
ncbi:MAG: hypothetical protein H0W36_02810 [Gemmatimonadetes bacterium]|nr:hypothetical protein [Gemmatimonadota bacterium]